MQTQFNVLILDISNTKKINKQQKPMQANLINITQCMIIIT